VSYKSSYERGNWKALCDSCGRIVKATELQKRWDGLMVDARCFELRQPQDFVRGVPDMQAPPFSRPEPQNQFIPFTFTPALTINTVQSTATLTMVVL